MSGVTRAADGTVTGNTYDKYGTRNPLARLLQRGFERNLQDLLDSTEPGSLLDVGCGEGVLTERWARRLDPARVVGIDLDDPLIAAELAKRSAPNLAYLA
ncbi:MAG: class I SAM-dependent methyltransferase, partial [Solirubrobacteraceae bacterium]